MSWLAGTCFEADEFHRGPREEYSPYSTGESTWKYAGMFAGERKFPPKGGAANSTAFAVQSNRKEADDRRSREITRNFISKIVRLLLHARIALRCLVAFFFFFFFSFSFRAKLFLLIAERLSDDCGRSFFRSFSLLVVTIINCVGDLEIKRFVKRARWLLLLIYYSSLSYRDI